jgi:hypothetical protein
MSPAAPVPIAAGPTQGIPHRTTSRTPLVVGLGIVALVVVGAVAWTLIQNGRIVASLQATPTPTPFIAVTTPPALPGPIAFGTGLNSDTLEITGARTTFARSYSPIAWSATLSGPAGATTLTWIIASQSASGTESIVWTQDVNVSNPVFDTLANKDDLASLVNNAAGKYVMRYLRGATILAEGTFTLK